MLVAQKGGVGKTTLAISSRYLRRYHQTNHFAIGFSKCRGNRVRVDIHRGPNIGVSQEFLLHLKIDTEYV